MLDLIVFWKEFVGFHVIGNCHAREKESMLDRILIINCEWPQELAEKPDLKIRSYILGNFLMALFRSMLFPMMGLNMSPVLEIRSMAFLGGEGEE